MCRLLGILSTRTTSAVGPLLDADKSLWRQSFAQPRARQNDGWGLAYYDGQKTPRIFKSPGALPRERKILSKTAARAQGRVLLFHLRRASNPRGLPLKRLRGRKNVQPFHWNQWTFVHNGAIPWPDAVVRRLGAFGRRVRGKNDSEALFWLLMFHLKKTKSVPRALERTRRDLRAVHAARLKILGPGLESSWHQGLNIILSNGQKLWAYAENPPQWKKFHGALASPAWPYFQLAFLPGAERFLVSSEPVWTGADWQTVKSGELLTAERRGETIFWKKTKLPL